MIWHDHSRDFPKGKHALLSPSQPSFLNDKSSDDAFKRYKAAVATDIGTIVHDFADDCIRSKAFTKITKNEAKKFITMNLVLKGISRTAFDPDFLAANVCNYINDAIGYEMRTEEGLVHDADLCGGRADAIAFDERKKILRIHDLKTGVVPAKFAQLEIYAALFLLEYGRELGITPGDCQIILRIYQAGEVKEECPTAEVILPIMDHLAWETSTLMSIKEC